MKSNCRLLIVDDEPDIRDTLELILQDHVSNITLAVSGLDALEKIEKEEFDAVLSDVNMPKLNGIELLRTIRKKGIYVPFVFLTGYGDKEKTVEALRLGAFDILDKPWEQENLIDVICNALELGTDLNELSHAPDKITELFEGDKDNPKPSVEYLQNLLKTLAAENQTLKKKLQNT